MHKSAPFRKRPKSAPAGSSLARVARAADALRQGLPIRLEGRTTFTMLAAETLGDHRPGKGAMLVLSHARARTLKIRLYTPDIVALPLDARTTAERIRAIADPTADLATPLKGPFEPVREKLPEAFTASVKLAKLAGLLPAAVLRKAGTKRGTVDVSVKDILSYETAAAASLKLVTRARVPLQGAEHTELVAFRSGDGAPENIAIVIDRPLTPGPVLARLHSECFTGDLLGSLKCDCGAQLRGAIETISKAGGGVLLYLA
ncbi:MAG: GTP cyclohydrolase II, partial [Alphaproteobacteria bacterium]|nr:GTP cyclohydrolase II [Alphaproteobacteria bacterium]